MPVNRLHVPPKLKPYPATALTARFRCHVVDRNQAGFALVAVIWGLGLITLLGTAVIVGARYRTRVTSSDASVSAATAAAESAINFGLLTLLTKTPSQTVKFPLRCRMPGGESVVIFLEEEAGKVDLNTATPAILARLFTALTLDPSKGTRIAERIVEFRGPEGRPPLPNDPQAQVDKPDRASKTGFTTIMQLDQIDGVSPRLFRTALRFVTIRSGRPEPVAEAAPAALREALNLDRKLAASTEAGPAKGDVTIRADVRATDGTRFIREALISLAVNGRPYLIREWRHGDIDPGTAATASSPGDGQRMHSCFQTLG